MLISNHFSSLHHVDGIEDEKVIPFSSIKIALDILTTASSINSPSKPATSTLIIYKSILISVLKSILEPITLTFALLYSKFLFKILFLTIPKTKLSS
ncbi:hypothetical protein D3C85_1199410 [compost metagenome]